ncbi:Kef-type K+ transport system membrane component KefB [Povalibacter uvarum]|uniref:Kef-type K+ transport system membrane component KefB n=1 Tax=Povalibacter uvarum TaxID=732238 RepID=A0A841HMR0_9GAMM|nr:cation:proton antiporter [Povalibacter uvarum]MBB6093894.1 Kef-type K+ transport system membrane component KefB [Povalibacter uvarum]
MKSLKQASLYVATIVIATVAIFGVVRMGSSLPVPEGSAVAAEQVATAPATATAFVQNLTGNLNHPLSHLFIQLLVVIAACRVVGMIFVRIGLPAVVGEMSAGILLGPSLFGLLAPEWFAFVFPTESLGTLRLLSQVGICLFMFTVGMELNVSHVRSKATTAVAVSHASIVLPFLLGVVSAYFLFTDMAGPEASFLGFALFMGISMSITAFPVLARILQERGISRTALGSTAITCAAVDDVTAWSIMAFVVAIAKATSVIASGFTLLMALAFIAMMTLGVRRALPAWIGRDQLTREDPSSGTLGIIVCVVIAAALSTEIIGIHALFGAFLAGAIMPDVGEFRRRITTLLEKFSSVLLLPLFFAFTGLRTEIGLLNGVEDWMICLAIIAIATLGKLGRSAVTARVTGMNWRESLQLGALMNTRGLMELIALNIGYDLGILSPRIFTMLVIMAVVTTMMTGPLLTLLGVRHGQLDSDHEPSRA